MRRMLALMTFFLGLPGLAVAMPFWGAQQSSPPLTPPKALKPGEFVWSPGIAPAGPVSLVMSAADERLIVLRNGVEIVRAKLHVTDPLQPLGAHAFSVGQGDGTGQSALVAGAPARNWFAQNVYPLFVPGTTLVVVGAP